MDKVSLNTIYPRKGANPPTTKLPKTFLSTAVALRIGSPGDFRTVVLYVGGRTFQPHRGEYELVEASNLFRYLGVSNRNIISIRNQPLWEASNLIRGSGEHIN